MKREAMKQMSVLGKIAHLMGEVSSIVCYCRVCALLRELLEVPEPGTHGEHRRLIKALAAGGARAPAGKPAVRRRPRRKKS